MHTGFMHLHCLSIGKTLLTLRACPIYFYWGHPLLIQLKTKLLAGMFRGFPGRPGCLALALLRHLQSLFLLSIFVLVVSLAWAIIWMSVGVTPTSNFASAPKSLRISLFHPLGASHWSGIKPKIQDALLSSTRFKRPRRRDETTCWAEAARRSCLTPKLVLVPYFSWVYLVSAWMHLKPWW